MRRVPLWIVALLIMNVYAAAMAFDSPWALGNAFLAGALAMGIAYEWFVGSGS